MGPGQQPWDVLSALPAWQLTEVPRVPQRRDEGGPDEGAPGAGAARRAAELVSAYCRGAPVAVAWVREQAAQVAGRGARPCPAIEQAVGCRADKPGWPAQLTEMLTAFARSPWPRALLRRSPPRTQAAPKQAADD
jgi:hypothetical protein